MQKVVGDAGTFEREPSTSIRIGKRPSHPVFYDPTRRRRVYVALTFVIVIGCLLGGMSYELLRLTEPPIMKTLEARQYAKDPQVPSSPVDVRGSSTQEMTKDDTVTGSIVPAQYSSSVASPPHEKIVNQRRVLAFLSDQSLRDLTQITANIDIINMVLPRWYQLTSSGNLVSVNVPWMTKSLQGLRTADNDIPLLPIVMARPETFSYLGQGTAAAKLSLLQTVQALIATAQRFDLKGFCFDFSVTAVADQKTVLFVLSELDAALTEHRRSSCVVTRLDADREWLRQLSNTADLLVLKAVDDRSSGISPMPLGDQRWYSNSLHEARNSINSNGTVIALNSDGTDWNSDEQESETIGFPEVISLAKHYGQPMHFDSVSSVTHLKYVDEAGEHHKVWIQDAAAAYNELMQAWDAGLQQIAILSPGNIDPAVWTLIRQHSVARRDPQAAEVYSLPNYVETKGSGPLIKATGHPQSGNRRFEVDAGSRLITNETYKSLPETYEITRWGAIKDKRIVLTFDDGPDPTFTPQILDILKKYHVPAAFFVVGQNALWDQRIIQRIVAEGHEIGNHFFLHGSLSEISPLRLDFELNSTQRVISSLTGRYTTLVRPPYGVDSTAFDEAPQYIKGLVTLSQTGYVIADVDIDPRDWDISQVSNVASNTVRDALENRGGVILLHDAGGDRSHTVRALPIIIERLKAEGYRFVSFADLMGHNANDVMPPAPAEDARIDSVGLTTYAWFEWLWVCVFVMATVLSISRAILICACALKRKPHTVSLASKDAPLTVIVPAFNEEKVITKTIDSLLQSHYPNISILVIDDGSTDRTFERVKDTYQHDQRVAAIKQQNAGKAQALNHGFLVAKTEVVIAIDADTVLLPDAIGFLASHFADQSVVAVAGNAKVGNRVNLLTKMQAFEYIVAQNLDRRAFDLLNCITVVPGAIGAWRRSAIEAVGGYPIRTLAEDADLTISLLRSGGRIVYEARAIALTEAPQRVSQLLKQRFRWTFGMMQVAWRHRQAIGQGSMVGLVALPNIIVFQILLQVLAPVVDITFLLTVFSTINHFISTWSLELSTEYQSYFAIYATLLGANITLALVAFLKEPGEDKSLLPFSVIQAFFYHQILYWVVIKSVWTASKGDAVGWGTLQRLSTVTLKSLGRPAPSDLL